MSDFRGRFHIRQAFVSDFFIYKNALTNAKSDSRVNEPFYSATLTGQPASLPQTSIDLYTSVSFLYRVLLPAQIGI
jgi:hypothetical protein